jgi:thiamine-monophosphate kinase
MNNLTEREIIQVFANQFDYKKGFPLGFEDDVSAVPLSRTMWIIVKTDMLVASTDVPPGMTTQEAARKAVVATVSDFAAKGVKPRALMVSLGLPKPTRATKIRDIARGLDQAAREYDCDIIGGDTNQAEDFVIDIAGVGIADPRKLVRRDGAQPGDIVAVTGPFGKCAAGLRILMRRDRRHTSKYHSLVNAVRRPAAQLTKGIALARSGGVTSSIDSSDGLASSLHQIARASRVGISLDAVPIAADVKRFANEFHLSATDLALYGGEEYELVITARPKNFPELQKRIGSLIRIGIVEGARHGLTACFEGKRSRIEQRGWEHFT